MMASKHAPRLAILTGNVPEGIGIRELILSLKQRIHLGLYSRLQDFFGSDEFEKTDLLFVEETLLAIYGDQLRGRPFRVVPIVHSLPRGDNYELTCIGEGRLCLLTHWSEADLKRVLSESIALIYDQKHRIRHDGDQKGLSTREVDVLKDVARGLTNKGIADHLNISMNTVMTHRKNITSKLNIKTVPGLTFYALMNGLISGEEVETKGAMEE